MGRIEDYAIIGDCETTALVGRDGSIDWLCLPRFDSAACFAALLGNEDNGRWLIAPGEQIVSVHRTYRDETLVLETEFTTPTGTVSLVDFMPIHDGRSDLVRMVIGRRGHVRMRMDLTVRFDYGSLVPWVRKTESGISAIGGPDGLTLCSDVPLHGEEFHTVADFVVNAGEQVAFDLCWFPSHKERRVDLDEERALADTEAWWRKWSARCTYDGPWREAVLRSLITLKALTYAPTGAILAAPTTSLPEQFGGVRNWDYRFCWLRDATFTLLALLHAGYTAEAKSWHKWLLRAVAGKPDQIQIMYGINGERRLAELELPWLCGYECSRPVRIGNAASGQRQLDVYGEVLDATYHAWRMGLEPEENAWRVDKVLVEHLESTWREPDEGIWEVRGERRHFTHSKMMAWLAFDRAVKGIESLGLDGPIDRWRAIRDTIHRDVCTHGYNTALGAFVQHYGSTYLDASLLMMPLIGFLPASDERVRKTVAAIERHLVTDGFVQRYQTSSGVDGLPPGEAAFLMCSFWLVDNLQMLGRHEEAMQLFDRLLSIRNDVGLLAEGYDVGARRLAGNFPQAFSHVGLITSAMNLSSARAPADRRADR
ncbi:MAG TPA: glycoside hydrolase family 15 protein [Vicinamibacterales bacterium]|jgi:GH15 family glucan-1,4-alpha-glucosidase